MVSREGWFGMTNLVERYLELISGSRQGELESRLEATTDGEERYKLNALIMMEKGKALLAVGASNMGALITIKAIESIWVAYNGKQDD